MDFNEKLVNLGFYVGYILYNINWWCLQKCLCFSHTDNVQHAVCFSFHSPHALLSRETLPGILSQVLSQVKFG